MNISGIFKVNKGKFISICLLTIIEAISATYTTYLMTPAFNYIKQMKFGLFFAFVVLSAVFEFINVGLTSLITLMYNQQVQKYIHQIRNNISRHIFVKNDEKMSEIQNNLNPNMVEFTSKYTTPMLVLSRRVLSIVFSIGVLFTFNWSLVLLTLILSFIGLYLPKVFEKVTSSATFKVTKKNEHLLDTIEKWAQGLDELRRYASFGSYEGAIQESTSGLQTATIKDCYWGNLATAITSFVSPLGIVLLLFLSVYLYFTGQIVFGAVITSGIFANQILNAVTLLAESINLVKSSNKLRQKLAKLQEPVVFPQKTNSDKKIAQIEVKNLSISFDNGEKISYPDFLINDGEKVLLTGDSGTGKSTLFKLLLGQLKAKTGQILFKNSAGHAFIPASEEIGYVAQDSTLFPDTIENNITMFDPKLDQEATKMTKQVNLSNDLAKFPAGIKTKVDLDQENLSGGQKQKVVLARARVHGCQLLLIDEGTSAIDSNATEEILQKLLKSDQTIIMIAHNFSDKLMQKFDLRIHLDKSEAN